ERWPQHARILIVAGDSREEAEFADTLRERLLTAGLEVEATVKGQPRDARMALAAAVQQGRRLEAIACTDVSSRWAVLEERGQVFPPMAGVPLLHPTAYNWPTFLKTANLLNIANQISIIAILAIGMTLVVFTGGIDLSVGSLIALSAVVSALLI